MKPGVDYSPETRFAHHAFMLASHRYSVLQNQVPRLCFWYQTGTLQLAWNERESVRQEKLLARNGYARDFLRPIAADEASRLAAIPLGRGGLWFEQGGVVALSAMRAAALSHPRIRVATAGLAAFPTKTKPGAWILETDRGSCLKAQAVVFATGATTRQWFPELPVHSVRGQISCFSAREPGPTSVISGGGYALPPVNGLQTIGATFDRNDGDTAVRDDSHTENLQNLREWLPELGRRYEFRDIKTGWTGFRGATPDHMPIAGLLNGLYLIAGLGGKGLAHGPLLARFVADSIAGNTSVLDTDLIRRIAPRRFL